MSIIDDYKAIADRQQQIAVQEGIRSCPSCQTTGWKEYWDEEGGLYHTECTTCGNPMQHKPPTYHG